MRLSVFFLLFISSGLFAQCDYPPAAGVEGTTAIGKDSSIIVGWATQAEVVRGYLNITNSSLGYASAGLSSDATGKAMTNGVVSLGDSGYAILRFDGFINNGVGFDFVVFENSFSDDFLELAFVEVSSDGVNYFRFPAISNTSTGSQTQTFGTTDAKCIHNLAGKYRLGYGTPFDLDELSGTSGLNIDSISFIKIIDVVGSIDENHGTKDSNGNIINDPWPTEFESSGFDLDAVGVIHYEPVSAKELVAATDFIIYPNPVSEALFFEGIYNQNLIRILDLSGKEISFFEENNTIDVSTWKNGFYILEVNSKEETKRFKVLKQ